jgi:hypothetical protein
VASHRLDVTFCYQLRVGVKFFINQYYIKVQLKKCPSILEHANAHPSQSPCLLPPAQAAALFLFNIISKAQSRFSFELQARTESLQQCPEHSRFSIPTLSISRRACPAAYKSGEQQQQPAGCAAKIVVLVYSLTARNSPSLLSSRV